MQPLIKPLLILSTLLDGLTTIVGKAVAWLTLAMVGITCVVVFMRYFLESGSIALQESLLYLHGLVFLLGIPYTLLHGGHVRVDIFYQRFSPRKQAWVDLLGGLFFLLPLCGLILFLCWDYVGNSWSIHETSKETSGLPYVYILKSLLLVMPTLLCLQGISEVLKNLLFLMGYTAAHAPQHMEEVV